MKTQLRLSGITLLVIIIITSCLQGCYSLKIIPENEISGYDNKYVYVHSGYNTNRISNAVVEDGILTGTIETKEVFHPRNKAIHIYFAPDSILKKGAENVSIPLENIARVEKYRLDGLRLITGIAGTAGYIVTSYLTLFIIAYSGGDDH